MFLQISRDDVDYKERLKLLREEEEESEDEELLMPTPAQHEPLRIKVSNSDCTIRRER
jgi:hypothetical protein